MVFSKIRHNGEHSFVIANVSVFRHESGGWEHISVLWDGSVMFLEFVQLDSQSNMNILW